MIGKIFGRWTVLSRAPNKGRHLQWHCVCSCGSRKPVNGQNLKRGISTSCGCYRDERTSEANSTHRATQGRSFSPEYKAWRNMRNRCLKESDISYPRYGGAGIGICRRWDDYEKFLADMGPKPSALHSLDRIKNELWYQPGNCRWATKSEQNRNQDRWLTGQRCSESRASTTRGSCAD